MCVLSGDLTATRITISLQPRYASVQQSTRVNKDMEAKNFQLEQECKLLFQRTFQQFAIGDLWDGKDKTKG